MMSAESGPVEAQDNTELFTRALFFFSFIIIIIIDESPVKRRVRLHLLSAPPPLALIYFVCVRLHTALSGVFISAFFYLIIQTWHMLQEALWWR